MQGAAKILFVTTSHATMGESGGKPTGVWLEELATPYYIFRDTGAEMTVASIDGGRIPIDPRSMEGDTPASVRRFLADAEGERLLKNSVAIADVDMASFDGIFLPGGHGPMWDFPKNTALAEGIGTAFDAGKVISAVCHGVVGLVGAKRADGRPLVDGKRVSSFTNEEEETAGLTKVVPFLLETRLRELGAHFEKGPPYQPYFVVDEELITGQNPPSSEFVARHVLEKVGGRSKGAA